MPLDDDMDGGGKDGGLCSRQVSLFSLWTRRRLRPRTAIPARRISPSHIGECSNASPSKRPISWTAIETFRPNDDGNRSVALGELSLERDLCFQRPLPWVLVVVSCR